MVFVVILIFIQLIWRTIVNNYVIEIKLLHRNFIYYFHDSLVTPTTKKNKYKYEVN